MTTAGSPRPEVGIVMGSKSDLPLVKKVEEVFGYFGVSWEITVASAHRTPDDAVRYAARARERGIRVLVAAAGLSAALPGVVAAHTTLPVIGIPVAGGTLGGLDALLSTAQMPPGVPVATVAVNAGRNAALLCAQMLAIEDTALRRKLSEMRAGLAGKVKQQDAELRGKLPG